MAEATALVTGRTVLPRVMHVNTFVPVSTEPHDTPGTRLRAFIDRRWSRRNGGILGLAKKLHTSTETIYEWFRDEREPSLDHLTRLAEALSESSGRPVSRAEIVAVMDGSVSLVPLDEATEALMRRVAEQVLDERLGRR